ncbi:MAG: DegQ family serine endoprotease [Deltaproteobacteria bacterium]|mgnify:CR=1 FL=1|nr:DegQ family serine endoprotease [Deltaproteobacteria bacterium]MBW1918665.1 DegQ family serine endoprotease [Deltaproteobacteria bacterium]RLB35406.1 MAG: peptidase [Deltaproteobacteria bacterium]
MKHEKIFCKNKVKPGVKLYFVVAIFLIVGALSLFPCATGAFCAAQAGPPASFAQLAKQASPSVVNISTVKVVKGRGQLVLPFGQDDPFRDFFERFFGNQVPRNFKQQSLGTGFIIDEQGFILTNNHVVEKANEIKVKLADGREFKAKVIGRDSKSDLALIKIDSGTPFKPLPLGDSEKLEVGDWVIAIGNPFGLGNTVTAGIVSAKYRHIGAGSYDNFIQTDASINPGNSGGPLLDTEGRVIGINTAIYSQSGGSIGIGFAIPVNIAKDLLPQLKKGKVVRGWLGVMIQKITPDLRKKFGLASAKGALVADITPGGPADKAGIQRGDVIVTYDGREVKEMNDLPYLVGATPVGKKVVVEVIRRGKRKEIQVKIGKLKEETEEEADQEANQRLGMRVEEITPELARTFGLSETRGLVVVEVEPGSSASGAGLRPGDVIVEVDQAPITNLKAFKQKIRSYKPGDTVLLLVSRRGATLYLTLKMEG